MTEGGGKSPYLYIVGSPVVFEALDLDGAHTNTVCLNDRLLFPFFRKHIRCQPARAVGMESLGRLTLNMAIAVVNQASTSRMTWLRSGPQTVWEHAEDREYSSQRFNDLLDYLPG